MLCALSALAAFFCAQCWIRQEGFLNGYYWSLLLMIPIALGLTGGILWLLIRSDADPMPPEGNTAPEISEAR